MESWIFKAKLAENVERFKDMFYFVREGAKNTENLNGELKRLIAVSFNKLLEKWTKEWKILASIELKQNSVKMTEEMKATRDCRWKLESEINDYCKEILNFVDIWIERENSFETNLFLLRLREKAYRKIVEYQFHKLNIGFYQPNEKENHKRSQEDLWRIVTSGLSPISPVRIEIVLNIAIFAYEIEGEYRKAHKMAKEAFLLAIHHYDDIENEDYKDITSQIGLLRDYISEWEKEFPSLLKKNSLLD